MDFGGRGADGGGFLRLWVNAEKRHSAYSVAGGPNHVAPSPKIGLHLLGQGVAPRTAAKLGAVLADGAAEVLGGKARRVERLPGIHSEIHIVEDDLDRCLILLVA